MAITKPKIDDNKLKEIRSRFDIVESNEQDERAKGVEDLEFKDGKQWPSQIETMRKEGNRPCLTMNKIANHVDRIVGEQRMNKSNIKVFPVDDKSDIDTADVIEGLIRNIEYISTATRIYLIAFESVATCGRGAWRILDRYVNNNGFDKELFIQLIDNPFSVYIDPVKPMNPDWGFVVERIYKTEYKSKYPEAKVVDFERASTGDIKEWTDTDTVRIAEYFWKEKVNKGKLYKISDDSEDSGYRIDETPPYNKSLIIEQREIYDTQIWWIKMSGVEVLKGPYFWIDDSIYNDISIPIIMVWGKETNINGHRKVRGIIRHTKDSQRAYNYERSAWAETVSLAPKEHWLVTPNMIKGYEEIWKGAKRGMPTPYLPYKPDSESSDTRPVRIAPSSLPSGLEKSAAFSSEEIKDIDGIYDPSLGKQSNEVSGIAIEKRTQQSSLSNFAFADNLSYGIQNTGKQIIMLIPSRYNMERMIRILGIDEVEKLIKINSEDGFDMALGKYDCRIKAGPNFLTQRQEAVDQIFQLMQYYPDGSPYIADIAVRNMDWHGADAAADRLKKLVPPDIRGLDENEEPSPQNGASEAEENAQKLIEQAKIEQERADLEIDKAKLEQEKAKFEQEQVEERIKMLKLTGEFNAK